MLAIAGGKGGSGKTTTTLGLAAALEGPCVAVDADVGMPDLHALAGVAREPTLAAVEPDAPLAAAREHPDRSGVSVVPAPTPAECDPDEAVRRGLATLGEAGPSTLVDCPAGAAADAAAPLRAADAVLVVSEPCAPALQDAAKTAATARALGTPVVGALLTRSRLAPAGLSDLLGCPVLGAVPRVEPPVLAAPSARRAYADAARALVDRVRDGRPDGAPSATGGLRGGVGP
jgi:septum site-determining protein MinD